MSDRDPAGAVFEALADPMRRRLLQTISASPSTATELAGELPISRQAVAKHLTALSQAGLLRARAHRPRRPLPRHPGTVVGRGLLDRGRRRSVGRAAGAAGGAVGAGRRPRAGRCTDHWPVTPAGFGLIPKYGTAQPTIFWNAGPATVPP